MIIAASQSNLLSFMEARHHAGAKVAVLVIDEQKKFTADGTRQGLQCGVLRTAAILGCPTWFAELGAGASDTHDPLIRAAGFASGATAASGHAVLKKGQATNVFEGTDLSARLRSAGIHFLVIMGQYGDCCVHHTILGTPPKPKRLQASVLPPNSTSSSTGAPSKPLPKPSKPLPTPPSSSSSSATPTPVPRSHDAPRSKALPQPPTGGKAAAAERTDAVAHCIVLTSPQLINGTLPGSIEAHPKCYVFEATGAEMWPANVSQRIADTVRQGGA